jgi:hypothetical protein
MGAEVEETIDEVTAETTTGACHDGGCSGQVHIAFLSFESLRNRKSRIARRK